MHPRPPLKPRVNPFHSHLIHAAAAEDRLESDPMEDARLASSIRDHGQQVPILVRPDATRQVDLRLDVKRTEGFEDWLIARLPHLHRDWLAEVL